MKLTAPWHQILHYNVKRPDITTADLPDVLNKSSSIHNHLQKSHKRVNSKHVKIKRVSKKQDFEDTSNGLKLSKLGKSFDSFQNTGSFSNLESKRSSLEQKFNDYCKQYHPEIAYFFQLQLKIWNLLVEFL